MSVVNDYTDLTSRASLAVDAYVSSLGAPTASHTTLQHDAASALSALVFHSRVAAFVPGTPSSACSTSAAQLTSKFRAAASAQRGAEHVNARAVVVVPVASPQLPIAAAHARLLGAPRSTAPKTEAILKQERRAALLAERDALVRALDAVSLARPQLVADDDRLRSAASTHATLGASLTVGGTLSKAHVERGRKDVADVRCAVALLVAVAVAIILQRVLWGVFWVRIYYSPSLASLW
jgi:hypothetical protein